MADKLLGQNKTSEPPSNELAAAYIQLRDYLVHKPESLLLESASSSETRPTWSLSGKALLGTDGAFYTSNIFFRNLDKSLEIKPDDLKIYWAVGDGAASTSQRPFAPVSLKSAIKFNGIAGVDSQNAESLRKSLEDYNREILNLERLTTAFFTANSITHTLSNGTFKVEDIKDSSGKVLSPSGSFSFKSETSKTIIPQISDVNTGIAKADSYIKISASGSTSFVDETVDSKLKISSIIADISKVSNGTSVSGLLAGSSNFNSGPGQPTQTSPGVSLYEYVGKTILFDTVTTDYCDAFFNLIDNINLSLAVPFVKINIIDRLSKTRKQEPKMSLISFLKSPSDNNIDDTIFSNAKPKLFSSDDFTARRIASGKFVGTEVFLGPNTMLPDPTDEILNPRRLNPSVPLMSLLSFSTSIESQGSSAVSRKRGELSIVLHDRSRLNDIRSLVSLGDFSTLYFDIEWGYIHPHGDPSFNNPVGQYLNAMRFREIYSPNTYTMAMGEGGSMTININMLAAGYLDATNTSVITGQYVPRSLAMNMLNNYVFNVIVQNESSAISDSVQADIRPITEVLAKQDTAGKYIKRDFIDKILSKPNRDVVVLEEELKFIQDLKTTIQQSDETPFRQTDYINDLTKKLKIANVGEIGSDTFEQMKSKYGNSLVQEEYASIANILTQCVGIPFSMTGLYNEVQIHVFKFNEAAGTMASKPITQGCLPIDDFIGKPDETGSLYNTDGVLTALGRLTKALSNPDVLCYGIASQPDPKKTTGKPDEASASSPPNAGAPATKAAAAAKSKASATPPTSPDPSFKIPNIKWDMRTVPAKVMPNDSSSPIDAKADPEQLILQIIIYDDNSLIAGTETAQAYSYLSKFKGNLTGKTSGKTDNTLSIDDSKFISKIAYPNITYGAVNSVIKSIAISTNTRSALSTSLTIQAGQEALNAQLKSVTASEIRQIQLIPGSITLTIFGLPIIERGQSIYLDLGTGTTLDDVYKVTSVRHNLSSDFTTDLTLQFTGQGTLISIENAIDNAIKAIEQKSEILGPTRRNQDSLQAMREYNAEMERLK